MKNKTYEIIYSNAAGYWDIELIEAKRRDSAEKLFYKKHIGEDIKVRHVSEYFWNATMELIFNNID